MNRVLLIALAIAALYSFFFVMDFMFELSFRNRGSNWMCLPTTMIYGIAVCVGVISAFRRFWR
jgi:hypothetical protein